MTQKEQSPTKVIREIRVATHEDLPELISLARAFKEESPATKDYGFDEDLVDKHFVELIDSLNSVVFVATVGGLIVGGIMATIGYPFFSRDIIAKEEGMYIRPEFRGTRIFLKLIVSFEHWAHEVGAHTTQLGVHSLVGWQKTAGAYSKLGYDFEGSNYRRKL